MNLHFLKAGVTLIAHMQHYFNFRPQPRNNDPGNRPGLRPPPDDVRTHTQCSTWPRTRCRCRSGRWHPVFRMCLCCVLGRGRCVRCRRLGFEYFFLKNTQCRLFLVCCTISLSLSPIHLLLVCMQFGDPTNTYTKQSEEVEDAIVAEAFKQG